MTKRNRVPTSERGRIGARIVQLREGKEGWTQKDLAREAGLGASRIGNYEQGLREPRTREAIALGKALGVSAAHILCLDDDNPVLSRAERDHIRYLRAMPEKQRMEQMRHIAAMAIEWMDAAPDPKIKPAHGGPKLPHRVIARRK